MVGGDSGGPSDVALMEEKMTNEERVSNIQGEEDFRVGRKGVFLSQTALIYRRGVAEDKRL